MKKNLDRLHCLGAHPRTESVAHGIDGLVPRRHGWQWGEFVDEALSDLEDNCGHCAVQNIQAQTARDLVAEGEILDGIDKWVAESRRRWEESKCYQLD